MWGKGNRAHASQDGLSPMAEPTSARDNTSGRPEVMTVDETADLLRVNRKTIYDLIARGELPGVRRVGRSIRISRDAVLDWLGQGGVPPTRRRR